MTDKFNGKLSFDVEKKDWRVSFTNQKGKELTMKCHPEQLSADLPASTADPLDVEFERDQHGDPLRVRLPGKEFVSRRPAPPRSAPRERGEARNRTSAPKEERIQRRQNDDMKREFHNPYNFVPAVPRNHIDGKTNDLGDRAPVGHDRFHEILYSGNLRVRMTTITPLLLPDTARVEVEKEHKKFPVREKALIGENGKPVLDGNGQPVLAPEINPTAIKGMLRSAYEAVTNSRLSVFNNHDEQLAFRMDAKDALRLVPAVVSGGEVLFYTGTADPSKMKGNGSPGRGEPQYAAWLGEYDKHGKVADGTNADGSVRLKKKNYAGLDKHGTEVWAYITLWERTGQRGFKFWNVVELADGNHPKPNSSSAPVDKRPPWKNTALWLDRNGKAIGKWVKGFVCRTNHNIINKHDERVFFFDPPVGTTQERGKLTGEHKREWKRLIEDYSQLHEGEDPPRDDNGKQLFDWSEHITKPVEYNTLEDGSLCYARVQRAGAGIWEVLELYPVMISRRLHATAPAALLPKELHPAQKLAEMSPADRVFGWVRQPASQMREVDLSDEDRKRIAYRGQLRVGVVDYRPTGEGGIERFGTEADSSTGYDGKGLPLAILGQPKPQQGRFYVAQNLSGEAQPDELTTEDAAYMKETNYREERGLGDETSKGLRGRKVYPHHANLPNDYWSEKAVSPDLSTEPGTFFREYRRRRNKNQEEQRDSQNRSIKGWVKRDTTFEFDIHFINLSRVELGALLWLLTLNQKSNKDPDGHPRFFRFGGGKPLGFGSVRLELAGYDIRDGAALRTYYGGLSLADTQSEKANRFLAVHRAAGVVAAPSGSGDEGVQDAIQGYEQVVMASYSNGATSFEQVSFVAAFLRGATGFTTTRLPVHYPRARHYGDEVDDPDTPLPPHAEGLAYEWFVENNRGPKLVLPDIVADLGLPILGHKVTH
jgi:CRISPR-associated protein (TIGR03986 family)